MSGVGYKLLYSQSRRKKKRGGEDRESRILKVDNIMVCARNDPKNNMDITARGVKREGRGWDF